MKKILTLLLFLTAMVGTASATTIKKRIFIQNSGNWASPHLYMWKKTDDTVKPLGQWPGTGMMQYNGGYENWYYVDVELEENTNYAMILNNNGNGTQSADIDYNSATNKFFSVWGSQSNEYNINDLVYYLYKVDGTKTEMTLDGDLVLSTTIDNTSGSSDEYLVAPSFVTSWYGSDSKRWNMMIRPYSDYQNLTFANITSDMQYAKTYVGTSSNSSWHVNGIKAYFDLTVDLGNWTYSVSPYFTRTLPAAAEGYATFSSAYNVAIPSGLTAQYATGVSGTAISWANYSGGIAAEQGALLHGIAGQQYTFTPATSVTNPGTNLLKPILTQSPISQTAEEGAYTNFILTKNTTANSNDALGFYKVNTNRSVCAAGTAYLQVPTSQLPAQGANVFFSLFDEEVTGINAVNMTNDNQVVYDLQGRRVANPTRGLYIVNGKKVVLK